MINPIKYFSFLFFAFFIYSYSFAYQNEPDGFRGIKWGTDIKDLKDMKFTNIENPSTGIKIYKRENDEMFIGNAKIDNIEYGFLNDKFYVVFIKTFFYSDWESLRFACFQKFGKGLKPKAYIDEYRWEGEKTFMSLEYNDNLVGGTLTMMSGEMHKKRESNTNQNEKQNIRGF